MGKVFIPGMVLKSVIQLADPIHGQNFNIGLCGGN